MWMVQSERTKKEDLELKKKLEKEFEKKVKREKTFRKLQKLREFLGLEDDENEE